MDLGNGVTYTFNNEGYNYDSVVFQKGMPPLDSEFNLMQELLSSLARKTTALNASGWVSYREPFAEAGNPNFFYTQKSTNTVPEIAMVNGWPVLVTNTLTNTPKLNIVDMSQFPLVSGSRVDGVFLEVWRGLIADETAGITTPSDYTQIGKLRSISTIDKNTVWAVGDDGILIKTTNGGVNWLSQPTPTSAPIYAVKFLSATYGFIAGGNATLFKTEDGGAKWTRIPLPVTDDIYAIACTSNNLMVVVGAGGTILRSTDGFTFTLILNTNQATDTLRAVYFYDDSVGWTCGSNGLYLRTLDGGISWTKYPILVPDASNALLETNVTSQLNAITFANLNDGWIVGNGGTILRTTDGGLRWADISNSIYTGSQYTTTPENLNSIAVVQNYPVQINLSIANTNQFTSGSYLVDPLYIVLAYTKQGSPQAYTERLALAQYPTDAALVAAINAIKSSEGYKVFNAVLSYTETSYGSHDSTGLIIGNQSTEVKFSMSVEAWIVGNNGTVLRTQNGGARWTAIATPSSSDIYCVAFFNNAYGWIVGDLGEIAYYNATAIPSWVAQDTDIVKEIMHKVYFDGNNSALAASNLNNNSVHPDLKVETSARVQIQYRIRVVEGVDVTNYRDSGLGAPYVFSRGPNSSVREAGSYMFTNAGEATGDYGLWTARCRNSVDGYSYAVPMFLVSRRNSSPYNAASNVNGSTVDLINAIRPDGLISTDIVTEDIIDVRRQINVKDYSSLLSTNFDDLLAGNLNTSMVKSNLRGGQAGSSIIYIDTLTNTSNQSNLSKLVSGQINSQAIGGITGFAGTQGIAGIPATADLRQASFTSLVQGLYNAQPENYLATYVGGTLVDGQTIPGSYTGIGSEQVLFNIDAGATGYYNETTYEGLRYLVRGTYVDYSAPGLQQIPSIPLQVKNTVNGTPTSTVNFYGIAKDTTSKYIRKLSTGVPGFQDYVEATSSNFGDETTTIASMVRLHMFQQITANTTKIVVPKNNEGYFVYAIRTVQNAVDGGVYRVFSMTDSDGTDTSSITINLASTYTVTQGTMLEIVAEVTTVDLNNTVTSSSGIGQASVDRGETLDSYRSPYVSVFNPSIKGVDSFYKGVLLTALPTTSYVSFEDLSFSFNGNVVGLATMNILEGVTKPYCWVMKQGESTYTTRIIARVDTDSTTGFITGIETQGTSLPIGNGDTVIFPALVLMSKLDNSSPTCGADIVYRRQAPQTVQPLPATIDVQVVSSGNYMVTSDLGTGGGTLSDFFANPLSQIPVYTDLNNESYFFNLYGLQFPSFTEQNGYVTLPTRVSRMPGGVITLSNPGLDSFGRSFYTNSSQIISYKAESSSLPNPRKLMVPVLVKVMSSITSPFLYGELALGVVTTYLNTDLNNELTMGPTTTSTVMSLYKIPGMPLVRS
jgi:photosystem II stability/assembly factor-like uncharacterized protein